MTRRTGIMLELVWRIVRDLVNGMIGAFALVVGERALRSRRTHTPDPRLQRTAVGGS
jgi:hypothetical protein